MDDSRQKGIRYIVMPCYNEEDALETSSRGLQDKLHELKQREIVSDKA